MENIPWQCQIDNESSQTFQIHPSGGYVRDGLLFVQASIRMMVHDEEEKEEEDDDEDADDVCNDYPLVN